MPPVKIIKRPWAATALSTAGDNVLYDVLPVHTTLGSRDVKCPHNFRNRMSHLPGTNYEAFTSPRHEHPPMFNLTTYTGVGGPTHFIISLHTAIP
ncbi:hypothetical protein GDO78_016796 [Eleutherodactylus coqui]|uniref:Uncharacterized protein n=1 Tax=Eleutherodactylus coqui TaxID=57060 RepID=A0A8J6EKX8_ELECQ|nr:hypothetical protein GDO78_016796 [Eleutherodactylus coqui]